MYQRGDQSLDISGGSKEVIYIHIALEKYIALEEVQRRLDDKILTLNVLFVVLLIFKGLGNFDIAEHIEELAFVAQLLQRLDDGRRSSSRGRMRNMRVEDT